MRTEITIRKIHSNFNSSISAPSEIWNKRVKNTCHFRSFSHF